MVPKKPSLIMEHPLLLFHFDFLVYSTLNLVHQKRDFENLTCERILIKPNPSHTLERIQHQPKEF